MAKSPKFTESGIMEPEARFKHLASFGNSVAVDPNIPAVRYYRSGTEMERMAKVYLSEGNLEDAYILYLRFSTLFIEKIISHPEYKAVPATMKQLNKARLKDILNILEQVKGKLLERYKREYANYLVNKETERLRALELEKVREEEQRRRIPRDIPAAVPAPPPSGFNDFTPYDVPPSAPSAAELLDNIVYPNDFPSDKNRSPSAGLILPGGGTGEAAKRPTVDRTLKPSASYTGGLRMVVVPKDTMYRFLLLVAENTAKNIETCGILAGKLSQNRFRLTHVIIPKQRGTSDSCNTMNEEELFDVQDQHNLITLGWIHTHPSQTAFLSSVDLHTHCSYQMMLPEALAIVCAPKYQTNGFFCLTPSYGLDFISQCRAEGFHPHPSDPALFQEAEHYCLDESTAIEVIDLRTR